MLEIKKEDTFVSYTKKLFSALKLKVKEHNSTNSYKVNFHQLKNVFIYSASEPSMKHDIIINGFARINMFLRLLEPSVLTHEFKEAAQLNKASFKKMILDLSSCLSPNELDFNLALEDVKKYNLEIKINSLDQLYLDTPDVDFYRDYL